MVTFPFVAQRLQRIDARGAARRQVAGGERDQHQQQRRAGEADAVGRADADQQALEQPREREGAGQADADPGQRHPEPLLQDQRDDVAARGAEGHAHADLRRPLRGERGDDAVEADRREDQRERAERGQQAGDHPLHEHRDLEVLGERVHVEQRHVRVERAEHLVQARHDRARLAGGLHDQHRVAAIPLLHRQVHERPRALGDVGYLPSRATPTTCRSRWPARMRPPIGSRPAK